MNECDRIVVRAHIAEEIANADEKEKEFYGRVDTSSDRWERTTMIAMFEGQVYEVVEAKRYRRREVPAGCELPTFDYGERSGLIADKILAHIRGRPFDDALDFLAELTGAWILSYPKAIIQADPTFIKDEAHWVKTDDEFSFVMRKWLYRALH